MQSVSDILEQVYGGREQARAALGRNKSSPSNWKKAGRFPLRVAIQISQDAKARGIDLELDAIPTLDSVPQ